MWCLPRSLPGSGGLFPFPPASSCPLRIPGTCTHTLPRACACAGQVSTLRSRPALCPLFLSPLPSRLWVGWPASRPLSAAPSPSEAQEKVLVEPEAPPRRSFTRPGPREWRAGWGAILFHPALQAAGLESSSPWAHKPSPWPRWEVWAGPLGAAFPGCLHSRRGLRGLRGEGVAGPPPPCTSLLMVLGAPEPAAWTVLDPGTCSSHGRRFPGGTLAPSRCGHARAQPAALGPLCGSLYSVDLGEEPGVLGALAQRRPLLSMAWVGLWCRTWISFVQSG